MHLQNPRDHPHESQVRSRFLMNLEIVTVELDESLLDLPYEPKPEGPCWSGATREPPKHLPLEESMRRIVQPDFEMIVMDRVDVLSPIHQRVKTAVCLSPAGCSVTVLRQCSSKHNRGTWTGTQDSRARVLGPP
jgi:hypothetical protein